MHRVDRTLARSVGTSLGHVSQISGYLVRIVTEDDSISGMGWAHENPFIAGETAESIRSVIDGIFSPFLIGKDPRDIAVLMEGLESRVVFNYRAKSAIDMALHDLTARAASVPLYRQLGGAFRSSIPCIRMLGLASPEEMAKEAQALQAEGFRHFKLKIDATAGDLDRVRAVAAVLGHDGRLVLDANQAYTPKQAIEFANRLHDCPAVAILEQPVRSDDLDGMALVRRSVDMLVEADECVRTVADAYRVIEKQAADIISLKVPKMGGLYWTRKIADLCQAANIPNMTGAMVGSCIFDIVHTHLACSHPNISAFGCEIGDSRRLSHDVATGLVIRDGAAQADDTPGLGAQLAPDYAAA
jgi:L-alanine-DL-glutamate epimerase-like enolase superfamily enzyme